MDKEQKQNKSEENVRRSSSDENQHSEFLQNDPSPSNASQASNDPELNSQEDLLHDTYCEVQESDVLIQQLPEKMGPEQKSDGKLETRVFYEYPSDLDEESLRHLPQAYFDNRENVPSLQNAEVLNIEKTHPFMSPKLVSKIQENKSFVAECIKDRNKTILGKEALDPTSCNSRVVDPDPSVDICEFTYVGPKNNTKCLGYSSDEFADVEDNLRDSSSSDTNENSSGDNTEPTSENLDNAKPSRGYKDPPLLERKDLWNVDMESSSKFNGGFIKSRVPDDQSEDEDLPSSPPEASCSNYVPKSKRQKTYPTAAEMREGKTVRKNTMDTILEEPELEKPELEKDSTVNPMASQPPVSRTNPMIMRSVVGQRKDKCNVCNVRLGLCAIGCRCGGYYCAKHRYDREHNCTFDYRSMGAEEIRKNNPRVVAEKVRKL